MQDKITSVQQRLINAVMQKHGGDDTAANKELGWGKSRFNNYRFNRRCADDDAIVDLARIVGEDPKKAVIQHRAEQAKTAEMRQFWLSFGKIAASITLALSLSILTPTKSYATGQQCFTDFLLCKNCDRRHRGARSPVHLLCRYQQVAFTDF